MSRSHRQGARPIRAGAAVALAAALALAAVTQAASAQDLPAPSQSLINPLASRPIDDLKGFRDRPLFTRDRRPPDPPAEAEAAPAPEPDDDDDEPPEIALVGIMRAGDDMIAVIREGDATSTRSVHAGDAVGDWAIGEIGPSSITLRKDDRDVELKLFSPAATSGTDHNSENDNDSSADTSAVKD